MDYTTAKYSAEAVCLKQISLKIESKHVKKTCKPPPLYANTMWSAGTLPAPTPEDDPPNKLSLEAFYFILAVTFCWTGLASR